MLASLRRASLCLSTNSSMPFSACLAALALAFASALPAFAAERPAVLPDTMAQRVIACTSCHAKNQGSDAFFPRIFHFTA